MFCQKGALKNYAKLTRKYLCGSLRKLQAPKETPKKKKVLKKETPIQVYWIINFAQYASFKDIFECKNVLHSIILLSKCMCNLTNGGKFSYEIKISRRRLGIYYRRVFRTLPNIKDGAFCENS